MKRAITAVLLMTALATGYDTCAEGIAAARPVLLPTPAFKGQIALAEIWVEPLDLRLESKTPNAITDDADWFARNGLDRPEPGPQFELGGPRGELLFGLDSAGRVLYAFDFSNYVLAPGWLPGDRDYVEQELNWAAEKDAILYVSHAHRTYAESSAGLNGYITAIDIRSGTVIWRTEPLVCNSRNFLIRDDVIICGYGFTAEPDFVHQLNRHTGETIARHPVRTAPEWLAEKGGRLFVRCYDTDYVFGLESGR